MTLLIGLILGVFLGIVIGFLIAMNYRCKDYKTIYVKEEQEANSSNSYWDDRPYA